MSVLHTQPAQPSLLLEAEKLRTLRIFHVFYLKFVRVSQTNFVESQQSRLLLCGAKVS